MSVILQTFGQQDVMYVINPTAVRVVVHAADNDIPGSNRIIFSPDILAGTGGAIQKLPSKNDFPKRVQSFRSAFLRGPFTSVIGEAIYASALEHHGKGYSVPDAVAMAYAEVTGDYSKPMAEEFTLAQQLAQLRDQLRQKWGFSDTIMAGKSYSQLRELLTHPEKAYPESAIPVAAVERAVRTAPVEPPQDVLAAMTWEQALRAPKATKIAWLTARKAAPPENASVVVLDSAIRDVAVAQAREAATAQAGG